MNGDGRHDCVFLVEAGLNAKANTLCRYLTLEGISVATVELSRHHLPSIVYDASRHANVAVVVTSTSGLMNDLPKPLGSVTTQSLVYVAFVDHEYAQNPCVVNALPNGAPVIVLNGADDILQVDRLLALIVERSSNTSFQKNFLSEAEKQDAYARTVQVYSSERYANRYYERWRNNVPENAICTFLSCLSPGTTILDAGCGPGHHSQYMAENGYRVFGIDISCAAIRIANRTSKAPTFCVSDMRATSFRSESFHGIWACASIVHVPRHRMSLQLAEFNRLLPVDGVFAATISVGKRPHVSPDGRFFESYKTDAEFSAQLREAGFRPQQISHLLTKATTHGGTTYGKWTMVLSRKVARCG